VSATNIQYFDWGQVEWVYEPDAADSVNTMSIGIYTILPGRRQKRHIHYGDEQLLYVLSGIGNQIIGDKVSLKGPGSIFHIEAGSIHETINTGNEPLMELVISTPANYENSMFSGSKSDMPKDNSKRDRASIQINDEIKNIYDSFANSMKIPISIFNGEGNTVIEGKGFPALCETGCGINKSILNCHLYEIQDKYTQPQYSDPTAFVCPYGLSVFIMPIICEGEVIGTIKGGHIKASPDNSNKEDCIYAVNGVPNASDEAEQFFSKASIKAISVQFKKLNKLIVNHYVFKNTEIELDKKEEIIRDITRHETLLEESLKSTQEKVLNIQINNHFLFNTFNALASLAVKEKAFNTYDSIISLSKMFRYTLKTGNNSMKIKDEVEYLSNYIYLQKLRFGERLKVVLNISEEIEDIEIPFNCLQPILENSFIHGFKNRNRRMAISLSGKMDRNRIIIEICDNGVGMNEQAVETLMGRIGRNLQSNKEERLSGLMMIYSKLQSVYKNKFSFEILSSQKRGTRVEIILPVD